jgi:hypothetical protein
MVAAAALFRRELGETLTAAEPAVGFGQFSRLAAAALASGATPPFAFLTSTALGLHRTVDLARGLGSGHCGPADSQGTAQKRGQGGAAGAHVVQRTSQRIKSCGAHIPGFHLSRIADR